MGDRITAGQLLGTMGDTGRASACHLHFGISPPCPGKEWSVRRGVVWPYPYLDAWRGGDQTSPADEVARWLADNPAACEAAMADRRRHVWRGDASFQLYGLWRLYGIRAGPT